MNGVILNWNKFVYDLVEEYLEFMLVGIICENFVLIMSVIVLSGILEC